MNITLKRLEADIKRVITDALRETNDKHIAESFITVTDVKLSGDLSLCKIFFSALKGGKESDHAVSRLKNAEGFFKHAVSAGVKMRKIPSLQFIPDHTRDNFEKIDSILCELKRESHDKD